uniref:Uncharacterized protein n=1 Tax=Romanomermis culicivorax TaxID=13658 RepID=A0A915IYE7_ROMCU
MIKPIEATENRENGGKGNRGIWRRQHRYKNSEIFPVPGAGMRNTLQQHNNGAASRINPVTQKIGELRLVAQFVETTVAKANFAFVAHRRIL